MASLWKMVASAGIALVLGAVPVAAQGGVRVLVGGGSSIALGDLNDGFNNGPHGVLGLSFVPSGFPIGIRVDGRYSRIEGEDAVNPGTDFQIIDGSLNGVLSFSSAPEARFRPYLIAGVGFYSYKGVGENNIDLEGGSNTDFGVNAGAGFDFGLSENLGLFVEGRFHNVFTGDDADLGSGGDIQFIPISAGVRIGR